MALFHVGFISYTLRREVDINVVIPTCTIPEAMGMNGAPTHKHKAPFPVLYLLHGFGNNYRSGDAIPTSSGTLRNGRSQLS